RARHQPDPAGEGARARHAPGRAAVPLGHARPDERRLGERPDRDRARPERAHPGGEGALLRDQAGPAAARAGAAEDVRGLMEPTGRPAAWPDTYGDEAKPRVGFFTDTSICIGCKACEVACKE